MVTPDNSEKYVVEVSHGTLTNIAGVQAKDPDLTITVDRIDLEQVMGAKATFADLFAAGKATMVGDRKPFDRLRTLLVNFAPDFELVPGTLPEKAPAPPPAKDPFAQPEPADSLGG